MVLGRKTTTKNTQKQNKKPEPHRALTHHLLIAHLPHTASSHTHPHTHTHIAPLTFLPFTLPPHRGHSQSLSDTVSQSDTVSPCISRLVCVRHCNLVAVTDSPCLTLSARVCHCQSVIVVIYWVERSRLSQIHHAITARLF